MTEGIDIPINTTDAIKSVEALKRSLSDFGKSADDSLNKFGASQKKALEGITSGFTALKAAAGAAIAIFAGKELIGFFEDAVSAAAEEEQAMTRLKTALDLTGEGGKDAADNMAAFADEIEKTTKFSSEQTIESLALAKSFGLTNEQAKDLTKSATELSAVTGESLESSTKQLGNSFSGVTREIGKLIPEVQNLTKEQLASGEAIRLVSERYGGSAARQIQTFSGAIVQAGNAYNDFQKAIGSRITENSGVIAIIKSASLGFQTLKKFVDDNKESIQEFVTSFSSGFLQSISAAVKAIAILSEGFRGLSASGAQGFFQSLSDKIFAVTDLVLQLQRGFTTLQILLNSDHTSFFKTDVDSLEKAQPELAGYISSLRQIDKQRNDLAAIKAGIVPADIKGASADILKLGTGIDALIDGLKKTGLASETAGIKIHQSLRGSKEDVSKLLDEITKLEAELSKKVGTASDQATAELKVNLDIISRAEATRLRTAQQAEQDRFQAVSIANDKIIKDNKETQDKITADTEKAAAARKTQLDAIYQNPGNLINSNIVDSEEITAAIAGAIKAATEGAQGAKKLVGGIAGAVAAAYGGPQVGDAVNSLVQLIAGDPKVTAATFKGFFEAFPDIIDNIARSIPDLVSVLLDDLINKGLAVRLIKSLYGAPFAFIEEIGKNIGRAIGVETGNAFKGPQFRSSVARLFSDSASIFSKGINESLTDFQNGVFDAAQQFHVQVGNAGEEIKNGLLSIGPAIQSAMDEAGRSLGLSAISTLDDGVLSFVNKGSDIASGLFISMDENIESFIDKGRSIGTGLFEKLDEFADYFSNLGSQIAQGIKDNFSIEDLTGVGGGGGGSVNPLKRLVPKLAGGGEVKPGFNNDSLLAHIQSGENVVDTGTNQKLKAFLDGGGSGGISSALLAKIADLLAQPIETSTSVNVNGKAFADIMLNLSRRNARTAIA